MRAQVSPNHFFNYSVREEKINSVTHAVGAILSLVGMIVLLRPWWGEPLTDRELGGYLTYGLAATLLFSASALYHGVRSIRWRKMFKQLDHCSIYLFIAGSYTPLLLVTIQGSLAEYGMAAIWSIALAGILFKLKFGNRFAWVSLVSYLVMGWAAVFVGYSLWLKLPTGGLALLIIGGIIYSLGHVFLHQQSHSL